MSPRHIVLLSAVGMLFLARPAPAQTTFTIDVFNNDFGDAATFQHIDPTIRVGDTVRWVWVSGLHSTTSVTGQSESWDSGLQAPNFTFSHTFTNVGIFAYYCSIHGDASGFGMVGRVTVVPVPEPASILAVTGLAAGFVAGVRRRGRVRSTPTRARPAFTLIEFLVTVSVLGILTGLLLSAVQKVRESANYTRCRNHLRQIGLAVNLHETSYGYFPGVGSLPHQNSALVPLLPFLGQDNLHRRIDPDRTLFIPYADYGRLDAAQAAAAGTVVPTFLCPSDGLPPLTSTFDYATLAGTNYVANAGTGTGTYYDFRYPTDGVVWYGSKIKRKDVTDGTSSTVFFAEALRGTGVDSYDPNDFDPRRSWMAMGCTTSPAADRPGANPALTDGLCMLTAPGMTWRGDRNLSWIGGPGHRSVFNSYLMPNDAMLDCGTYGIGRFKASSGHTGGVNMVLGDGSVHFVKNHIDHDVWRALTTRGDREVIGSYCGCK